MEDQLISFETAKLAKEKGFYIKGASSFSVKDGSTITVGKLPIENEHEYEKRLDLIYKEIGIPTFNHKAKDLVILSTQSLLQKWLREKHRINVVVEVGWEDAEFTYSFIVWNGFKDNWEFSNFKTYEEALELGLVEGLKFITNE